MKRLWFPVFLLCGLGAGQAFAALADLLVQAGTIPLPAVKGRIDHMDLDAAGGRLFIAALGNDTLEVVDVQQNRHLRSLGGFGNPQGVVHAAAPVRLFVASGSGNRVDILDAASLAPIRRIGNLEDADNLRYDAAAGQVYVGYGSGALRVLDARTGDSLGDIKLSGHPESFQLERSGKRIFVNVPSAGHIAVVDRTSRTVVATWPLQGAAANFPMALDEPGRRLYVATRGPAALLVYDTGSGKEVDRIAIGGDADDIFFDASSKRIYAICGEGVITVVAQTGPGRHAVVASVKTASGARTGLFDPGSRRLFVAVRAGGGGAAELRIYSVR
jgi:DNA-binding beta-propeller fold protein YncE